MINLNKIKKFASRSILSAEQLLYIEYAELIGLKLDYLDSKFTHIKTNKIYTIEGFIWKYTKALLTDSYLNNELYIHLKYDKSQDEQIKQQKKEQIANSQNLNLNNTKSNGICTTSIAVSSNSLNYIDQSISYNTSYLNTIQSITNDIDSIKRDYQLNELIEFNDLNKLNKYINLLEFQEQYLLNGKQLLPINVSPKFKIVVEN